MSLVKRRAIAVTTILAIGAVSGTLLYRIVFGEIVDSYALLTKARVISLSEQIEFYRREKGRYPSTEEGLSKLVADGYLRAIPEDGWHREFLYRYPSTKSGVPFELWSLGADGRPGGSGDDADIGNWKQVTSNNALELSGYQRGPRLAAARSSWPAAQRDR
jgi:general secretion pathway protein G